MFCCGQGGSNLQQQENHHPNTEHKISLQPILTSSAKKKRNKFDLFGASCATKSPEAGFQQFCQGVLGEEESREFQAF